MANHAIAAVRQLSESVAAAVPPAHVQPRTATRARAPVTAEIVARPLRRSIVDGHLKDGDFPPTEAELLNHHGWSTWGPELAAMSGDLTTSIR